MGNNKSDVINIKKRIIAGIIIAVLAVLISTVMIAAGTAMGLIDNRLSDNAAMLKRYVNYYYDSNSISTLINLDDNVLLNDVRITASAIRELSSDGTIDLPAVGLYKKGCVFRYDGTNTELPEGLPSDMYLEPIRPYDESGILYDSGPEDPEHKYDYYLCKYAKIAEDLYYMEWDKYDNIDFLFDQVDWSALKRGIYEAYDTDVLVVYESDQETYIMEGYGEFSDFKTIDEFGLSRDTLKKSLDKRFVLTSTDRGWYVLQALDMGNSDLVIDNGLGTMITLGLTPLRMLLRESAGYIMTFILLMIMMCVMLAVWIISTYRVVSLKDPADDDYSDYSPVSVKSKAAVFILVSCLIMFAGSALAHAMTDLSREASRGSRELNAVISNIATSKESDKKVWKHRKIEYSSAAEQIAEYMDKYPQLRTRKWLREVSKIIGAEYCTVYDAGGNEILSDSKYRGLSLGSTDDSATYDFRLLLTGVSSISRERVKDERIEKKRDMYGVPLNYPGNSKSYGALIVSVDPSTRNTSSITDINAILRSHSEGRYLSFTVDAETGVIKHSSDPDLIGSSVLDMGITKDKLRSSYIGFFTLNNSEMFGRSYERDGLLYYFSTAGRGIFFGAGRYAFTCMIMFMLIIGAIAYVFLNNYGKDVYSHRLSEENVGNSFPVYQKYSKTLQALGVKDSPFRIALLTLLITAVVSILIIFGLTLLGESQSGENDTSVIRYIISGDWEPGFNIFSVTAVFFLICDAVIIIALLYVARIILGNVLNARGATISTLITSFLRYLTVIIAVLIALGYLGVNYQALLASVGIAGMAITFGARDLIADIFAGINILISGSYKIGDIVEIDGFRGSVQDMNLRTTRVIGDGGNIKTIRNNNIVNIVNLSIRNSWIPTELTVSASHDESVIENMLSENLPKIKSRHRGIISGPEYRGIQSIGGGKLTILILTECSQPDYYKVERVVNKELHKLFKENKIDIL